MRVSIHPLFIVVTLLAFCFSAIVFFCAMLTAVILHELAHVFVARGYGVVTKNLMLTPFGGAINLTARFLTVRQRRLIYLAGPMANFFWAVFCAVLVWLFPVGFTWLEYLVVANFLIGALNLLPIFPLDGGKLLASFVSVKIIMWWSNLCLCGLLVIALFTFNFVLAAFVGVMLLQVNWEFRATIYADKLASRLFPKTGKFIKQGVWSSMTLLEIYKLVDMKQPTEFVVTDFKNYAFYESDLEQWLLKKEPGTRLRDCLVS